MVFTEIDKHVNVNSERHINPAKTAALDIAAGSRIKSITRSGHRNGYARALAADFANRLSFVYALNRDLIDYAPSRYSDMIDGESNARPVIDGISVTMSLDRNGALLYNVDVVASFNGASVETFMVYDGTCGCVTSYTIGAGLGRRSHSEVQTHHKRIGARKDFANILADMCVQYVCEMHTVARLLNEDASASEIVTGTPAMRALLAAEIGTFGLGPLSVGWSASARTALPSILRFLRNDAEEVGAGDHDDLLVAARDAVGWAQDHVNNNKITEPDDVLDVLTENMVMFLCGERMWAPFKK